MINLAKKFKSVIAAIVLSFGALVASQAHAYTINDYNSVVAQLNSALADAAASAQSSTDTNVLMQNEYQVYLSNILLCNQHNNTDQYAYNDCLNGYIAEYDTNMQRYQMDIMYYEANYAASMQAASELEALRNEIAAALGIG